MKTVHVNLGERSYDIHVGEGCEALQGRDDLRGRKALLITDSKVDRLLGARWTELLTQRGLSVTKAVVPAGEPSKDLVTLERLYAKAADAGLDRKSLVVALGGGVVGDLGGFMAASYLRGVAFLQVPTTLLAMVDSSVGGKTGINLPQGKNLVGAFHQPVEVVADIATLATLPDREFRSGLAEVIKYGIIWDAPLFQQLEADSARLLARDTAVLESVVARCCEIKAEVVGMDERETGVRAILNFGHTLGHAIEQVLGYGKWLHGEAVAAGMVYAAILSREYRGFPGADCERLIRLVQACRLPAFGRELDPSLTWAPLRKAMSSDKKAEQQVPRWVLTERLGGVRTGCELTEAELESAFSVWMQAATL